MKCQAQAMSFGFFEDIADPVPPCESEATVDAVGYSLCGDCFEALETFVDISRRRLRREEGDAAP